MFQDFQSVLFSYCRTFNIDAITMFNPKGDMFAYPKERELWILQTEKQKTCHRFMCDDLIESIEWSPDSELIYCSMCNNTIIQVWNLLNPSWRWKLVDNPLPFINIHWAPDSRHLLVVSEFHIKIKIWSFVSTSTTEIESPKPVKHCLSFSPCKRYLAVAIRTDVKDEVGIYTCETWEILLFFPVETRDLAGIEFSPCDNVIAVLEAPMEAFKVLFYSIDGRLLSKYEKTSLFGIKSLSWHQSGKFLALGSYSGEATILNGSNYKEITSYQFPETIISEDTVVYRVVIQKSSDCIQPDIPKKTLDWQLFKVVKERPVLVSPSLTLLEKKKVKNAREIKYGVRVLMWSADSEYLAAVCGNQPNVLWIYNARKLKLASIVIHCRKIKDLSWHAEKPILTICTGYKTLDMWMPSCCASILSPFKDNLVINSAKWNRSQDSLVLNGRDTFSILVLP